MELKSVLENWNFKIHNEDAKIDVNPLNDDQEVAFVYNEYSKDGLLIGPSTEIGTDSGKYRVSASNDNVEVSVNDKGEITVTAKKAGTSTITVKEGTIVRATTDGNGSKHDTDNYKSHI